MNAIRELQGRIDELAARGHASSWGAEGGRETCAADFTAAARTLRGLFRRTTSFTLSLPFQCGNEQGLLLVVAEGNSKDEASMVAAAAAVSAFADVFDAPLLAEADIPPALRRAVLGGHDRVLAISGEKVSPERFGTVGQPRTTLEGIGACVAAAALLAHRAWLTWVGDCPIVLLREGQARRLSLPHTLGHDPGYRAAIARDPEQAFELADMVVMKVLGVSEKPPSFDVTRLDLQPADRIVLGNEWVAPHVDAVAVTADERSAAELCDLLARAVEAEPGAIPVTVVVAARR